jgi:hypothetical protein
MKTSSAKAKGQRLVKLFADQISETLGIPRKSVLVTPSGVTGQDLSIETHYQPQFPFAVEAKSHAKISIYKHFEQARSHAKSTRSSGTIPVLVVKQDRSTPLVVMDAGDWLALVSRCNERNNTNQ